MRDLVEFLRARLDEDERAARAATPGPWRHNPEKHWRKPGSVEFEEAVFAGPAGADATCVAGTGETDDRQSMTDADHIARWDPVRVLREVRAKRMRLGLLLEGLEGETRLAAPSDDPAVRAAFHEGVKALARVLLDVEAMAFNQEAGTT